MLSQLVQAGDIVLMDLRSFSAVNAGCIHELRLLVREVPFSRCLLVVDAGTDAAFLRATLEAAWEALLPDAANHGHSLDEIRAFHFAAGGTHLERMVDYLCRTAFG